MRQILSVEQWQRFESALDLLDLSALPTSLKLSEQQWKQLEQIAQPDCKSEILPKHNDDEKTLYSHP